ncbi:hypothetical protein K1719_041284 [Acacia pycnantha]|nr:hypothetical protein K1719_041284 [Acacia pycnantha]
MKKFMRDKEFYELVKDGEQPLYGGCQKYSKLSFIVKLYHIKCLCGMTDKSMNMILELLCDAFEHAKIPSSFYEAKKTITKLGLDYRRYMLVQTIVCCIGAWKMKTDKVARFVLYLDGSHLLKKIPLDIDNVRESDKNIMFSLAKGGMGRTRRFPARKASTSSTTPTLQTQNVQPSENLENDIQRVESRPREMEGQEDEVSNQSQQQNERPHPFKPKRMCNKYWVVDVKGFFEERLRIRDVLVLPPHKQVVVTWSEENQLLVTVVHS